MSKWWAVWFFSSELGARRGEAHKRDDTVWHGDLQVVAQHKEEGRGRHSGLRWRDDDINKGWWRGATRLRQGDGGTRAGGTRG